ncbi:MAG: ABC transporter ATP-binding protein [Clostridia bacterium]|nr:ABC transporter ATP-binding protein [Clostridia bacterium]
MKRKEGASFLSRLFVYLRKHKKSLVMILVASVLGVASTLALPLLFGRAADAIVGEGKVDFNALWIFLTVAGVLAVVNSVMEWITEWTGNKIANSITCRIRRDAFNSLQRAPLKIIDRRPIGEILSVEIGDADKMSDGLILGFSKFLTGILTIVGTLVCMFIINPVIAVVVGLITPLSLFTAKFITGRTYSTFKSQAEITGKQTDVIEQSLGNLAAVKTNNAEKRYAENFDEINSELGKDSFKAIFYSSLTNPTTRFINALVYAAVAFTGAMLALNGGALTVTAGTLLSLLGFANKYAKPFNEISSVLAELTGAKACAERLFAIIDGEKEESEEGKADVKQPVRGEIEIKNLEFSYDRSRPLIRDFNLSVERGQKVAIVGPTGCGKTTLINLLMRFYEIDSGVIKIDGVDTRGVNKRSLRSSFGMVLQDTWIRKATVWENIAIGKKDATREEIEEACRQCFADGFIRRLPKGYDTVISEDALSQGQKQLLCIARVMLVLPPILILDEATSNIDTRTEIKIQRAFDRLTKGKTSFIVAHRLSTVKTADIILAMKDGNVVEQGDHAFLMGKKGFYYSLYTSQFEKN